MCISRVWGLGQQSSVSIQLQPSIPPSFPMRTHTRQEGEETPYVLNKFNPLAGAS